MTGPSPTTPSQTIGPFFAHALPWPGGHDVVPEGTPGRVRVHGRVLDGAGDPVPDALLETWQPSAGGRGFGRVATAPDGTWAVHTTLPDPADGQAPHLAVSVFARGLLHRVVTRIYFADRADGFAADPVLAAVDPARRATLIAEPDGAGGYRFDIRLQGSRETVFFEV